VAIAGIDHPNEDPDSRDDVSDHADARAQMRQRLGLIQSRVDEAVAAAGRVDRVRLIGISKRQPVQAIQMARSLGLHEFGENYAQEFSDKFETISKESARDSSGNDPVTWHFVGKLQRNKIKQVVGRALIHTVDRTELLEAIEKRAQALGVVQECLVEVNWGESQKAGVDHRQVESLLSHFSRCRHARCIGLMTIPPAGTPELSRSYFCSMRELQVRLQAERFENVDLRELSMGMSADFYEAILEGATMVRVGTAIFGERS
jgi:pyridoxal phosphate enzyme (YggS family)